MKTRVSSHTIVRRFRYNQQRTWLAISFLLLGFLAAIPAGQLAPLWTSEYSRGEQQGDFFTPLAVDMAGNTYFAAGGITVIKVNADGQQVWAKQVTHGGSARRIDVDALGNVYVVGQVGFLDALVLKINANGKLLWQAHYDGPEQSEDWVNDIGVDSLGHVYVSLRVGGDIPRAGHHTILKYDRSGELLWTRDFDGSTNSRPLNTGNMAVNPLGGVAVSASRAIASFSANGELRWSWQLQSENDTPLEIAFDSTGHLVTAFRLESLGFRVVKFSRRGVALWSSDYIHPVPSPFSEMGEYLYVRVHQFGDVYVGTDGPVNCFLSQGTDPKLKCTTLPMLAKFHADGELSWVSRLTVSTNLRPELRGMALDPSGRTYLGGRLIPRDESKPGGFVAKLDMFGNQVWGGEYYHDSSRVLFFQNLQSAGWNRVLVGGSLIEPLPNDHDHLLLKFSAPRSTRIMIVRSPASQTVAAGQSATFGVAAIGARGADFQWRFNGQPLPGQTGRALTIPNVQLSHAGDYSVAVSDRAGTIVSPEARLTVLAP